MTNREKYKKAFSAVRPSDEFIWEESKMRKMKKQHMLRTVAAAAAACVVFMSGATVAYAMDVGGIQRRIQLWVEGDCTDATIQLPGDGTYSVTYTDAEGNENFRAGGGVEFDADGREIPMSEEDLIESLMMPDVEYEDDGSVWVYWLDQKVDITDKFTDGVCYVKLVNGEDTMYVTVKYKGGYAADRRKYADPDSWGTN